MDGSSALLLAEAIAQAAATVNGPAALDERLEAVVRAATDTVPGFDEASVSVAYRDGRIETRAATSELVKTLDQLQYDAEQGPCFEAFTRPGMVLAPSLRDQHRWPGYVPAARERGVLSQMAVHLGDGGQVRGALNLYGTREEGIDPEAPGTAALFATHASLALGWARTEEQLNTGLATRKVIGQAIGIVMERYQINEAKAFAFLARVSQTSNVKLRDVARELITQTDARYTMKDAR